MTFKTATKGMTIATALVMGAAFFGHGSKDTPVFGLVSLTVFTPAHAAAGRPLTPTSVAGVSRRTSRRTARRN